MFLNSTIIKKYTFYCLILMLVKVLVGCGLGDDTGSIENGINLSGNFETFELQAADDSGISGVAVFEEFSDGTTLISIELDGTQSGDEHPAHIHANTAAEGGGIDLHLNPVDGTTGRSETDVIGLDDGTSITYQELIAYNGHIMVHLSEENLATVISRGDIGGNAFTGESITYELWETGESGVSGHVLFEERQNGNTLSTLELTGTTDGEEYEAHIHNNSVAEGGGIAFPFNNIDGTTGVSVTNIRADQTTDNLTYTALLEFDGHVNVHDPNDLSIIVSQGNIGANEGQSPGKGNSDDGDY